MAHIEEIPEPTRSHVVALDCPRFEAEPWVRPPPLARARVAILTSAALHPRDAPPFPAGSAEARLLADALDPAALIMSHVSINFDRTGFQRDLNVVYPTDRLRGLAATGVIGAAASTHFSVMGSTDPRGMEATADQVVGQARQDRTDAVLLVPV
ncbi:hypothetical protein [Elioraea sp.]|uniref:hypothetical protein n=1 Tax=Elioraea sp. TaxID=2185103 RepID=UPI003F6F0BA5